jgi:hypothetical protein
METLLKPGDMIRIRKDIGEGITYKMYNDASIGNGWIKEDMISPGTLVEIKDISNGQYIVQSIEPKKAYSNFLESEDFWLYTDGMFDPNLLNMLITERIKRD